MTLNFLGEIDPNRVAAVTTALEEAVAGHDPFQMVLRGMGTFPNDRYIKVVWIGIDSDELAALARDVIDSLADLGFDRSKFSPHLTLARVKGPKPGDRIREMLRDHRETDFGRQDVKAVHLMKSTLTPSGPIYEELARAELGAITGS
jgi:2'-5' RNA ligase